MRFTNAVDDRRMLLVTASDPAAPPGGREMLYRLNQAVLADLFGTRLRIFALTGGRAAIAKALRGHIDGIDAASLDALLAMIAADRITDVFLDGSNLGIAAAAIKRRHADVRVTSFFHNVEARFFLGSLRVRRSPRALAVLVANYVAERAAVRSSDIRICLSRRDSDGLRRLYGRGADAIAPMVLADRLPRGQPALERPAGRRHALFVGGAFYANVEGMRWFAREVAPHIAVPTVVVGRGMEVLAEELAGDASITLVGAVDDVAPWYHDAAFVIAPIFDGSGMKTKVAEALMFGKRIVGTSEAFSGYDEAVVASGWCCDNAERFIAAISDAQSRDLPAFDPELRAMYLELHSFSAARSRMAAILDVADRCDAPHRIDP